MKKRTMRSVLLLRVSDDVRVILRDLEPYQQIMEHLPEVRHIVLLAVPEVVLA